MVLLSGFLLLGLLGVYGVRTRSVHAAGGGYELTVRYGAVTRAGLATVWDVEVRKPGGFDDPVTLASTASYFALFDENGLDPDPATATTQGDLLVWEFEPPPTGDTLMISFDARIEPAVQWGKEGETSVLVDGEAVVTVRYRTWVIP
jgi:hypothetical protein